MKTEQTLQIYPCMCEQQRNDLDNILCAIDEFGANTLALANQGPHGYATFIETRDKLRSLVKDTAQNYRLVVA